MKNIKQLRKDVKLTQNQASKEFGITKEYLSMIERGERNPSDNLKDKMSKLYKTSIQNIFLALKETKCCKKQTEA